MTDFLKKLNVLIKAGLNDIVSSDAGTSGSSARRGRSLDDDVAALRERVNDAVRYEDEIKRQIAQLETEAGRWDQQADEAVARGDDASARYAIEQMRRAEQRAALAQGDLREHQRVTQDLIARVNALDAAVADAHREQPDAPHATPLPDLSNVLREARATIASLAETAAARREVEAPEPEAADIDDSVVDDDLERRRQRLSKR